MATNQGTTFAFIVSLIGGLVVFIMGIINVVWLVQAQLALAATATICEE